MRSALLVGASRSLYSAFVDLVFPSACVGCSNFGPLICKSCLERIGEPEDSCIFCNTKTLHGRTCHQCQKINSLSGIINVGKYQNEVLRNAVHDFKFSGVKEIVEPLGEILSKRILQALGNSLSEFTLAPLPLHPIRMRERGFNQSELLAQKVSKKLSVPYRELLIRTRATKPQAKIDHKTENLRKENVAKAFSINTSQSTPIPEKVILIDDVATSGATIEEAAKTLHNAGVKEIWGAVICRG